MVNLLIGNKDTTELDILYQKLANDKDYRVESVNTGKDTLAMYGVRIDIWTHFMRGCIIDYVY